MSSAALSLPTGSAPYSRCLIHPVVVFNILDHYIRRTDSDRVIGALLGNINEDTGIVEIRNCFPIPHSEGEQTSMNIDYHRKMIELHRKMSPEDIVVGWYTTGDEIRPSAVLFQKFFWKEMNQAPVHLMVGTDLSSGSININTYYSLSVSLTDRIVQNQFLPLPFDYVASGHERAAFDILGQSKSGEPTPLSDLGSLELALKRLYDTLDVLSSHIKAVVEGKTPQNQELGRFLHHTFSLLPSSEISFESMFNNGTLDTLMLIYLANLTRSHLFWAEKSRDQIA